MKKRYRIKKNEEFAKIIQYKHRKSSAAFVVYFTDAKEDISRVGISVSKKLGDAVKRNKIKRQVREMVKDIVDFENCHKDLVIIVKPAYLDKDFYSNKNDLEILIKKAII